MISVSKARHSRVADPLQLGEAALIRRHFVQRIMPKVLVTASLGVPPPIVMEVYIGEVESSIAECVQIGIAKLAPINELNAELECPVGLLEEIVLV